MQSLKYLYRIGKGPSSSHTMGPQNACLAIIDKYQNIKKAKITLFGSLAWTGKGHLTDQAIHESFKDIEHEIVFNYKSEKPHPNTMEFSLTLEDGSLINEEIYSIGGGEVRFKGEEKTEHPDIYPEKNLEEIIKVCKENNWRLYDYVYHYEGEEIKDYLREVYRTMMSAIERGISKKGKLPGRLAVDRKAYLFAEPSHENESDSSKEHRLISCYAFAVGEENASGGIVVTAPTCGAAATMPAVIRYMRDRYNDTEDYVINAIATAGVIGNCLKHNGSISGAEAGCQAEIGSACAMTSALLAELRGYSIDQIEHAAEIGLEHHLGLTCDPVDGYVQVPCIERNAVAASKAIMSCFIAEYSYKNKKVSFDEVVKTMLETGRDIHQNYRETAVGGLAKTFKTS